MTTERLLLALLLGGVGVGCVLVLYPFFSALLWAGILVFTTWPACDWLHETLRLRRGAAAGVMVTLIAVVIVLPLALAEPVPFTFASLIAKSFTETRRSLCVGTFMRVSTWVCTLLLQRMG